MASPVTVHWMCRSIAALLLAGIALAFQALTAPAEAASPPRGCPAGWVGLTFDDGPDVPGTPETLDILDRFDAGATFFVMGSKVVDEPALARQIADAGHTLANHTHTHPRITDLSDSQILEELWRTERAALDADADMRPLFRPPGFRTNTRTTSLLRQQDYRVVHFSVNPQDWRGRTPQEIVDIVLRNLHPDAIIVLHERIPATVEALPTLLTGIYQRGYCAGVLNDAGDIVPRRTATRRGAPPFFDAAGTFERNIGRIASAGVTRGCNPPTNSRYCPEREVTRGEMATLLTRAFDLPAGAASFVDSRGTTHERGIAALADAGITRGCDPPRNSRFCPDRHVTRAEMATFLDRLLDLPSSDLRFADAVGNTHEAAISRLGGSGLTSGCGSGRFCPDDPVTRGQMAAFIDRARTM